MNEDTNVQEFFDAFEDTGYQTGDIEVEETAAETEETEQVTEEADREEAAEADKGEAPANEETPTGEKDGAEGSQEPEMFTLKVNKEERRVTREEMVALAQKGSDYDRIKAAAEQAKSDNTALKEQNAKMQEAFDLLTSLAEESKVSVPELLDAFRVNRLKGQGLSEDAAKERVAREKAERELQALKAENQAAQNKPDTDRAAREVAEFRKAYPDVALTKELVDSLTNDVQAGMTLIQAYQKQESAKKDAQIEQLRAELEAEKKNKANRASTPGSQNDSGARRVKSKFDDFWDAFE